jgi:hypothetical protein
MKGQILTLGLVGLMTLTSRGGLITYSSTSGTVPDGNPVGWSATATVSGELPYITSVSVNLELSGGYNGDLYAYLSHEGVLVPLLNRVGVGANHDPNGGALGWGTAGMNVTLADGYANIHWVGSPTSGGSYAPDGRQVSPLAAPSAFDDNGTIGFSAFNGKNVNGAWTLFFADLSSGETSQLANWSLAFTSEVPEPVNVALGIFAGIFLVAAIARNQRVRGWVHRRRDAVAAWINAV